MDIVSRLKIFMKYLGIANSQFADTCKIPRPTISQVLNGRNKKISDELIGKIHEAYPNLSVLWLMFGEGDMVLGENFEVSKPQNSPVLDFDTPQNDVNESLSDAIDFMSHEQEYSPNNPQQPQPSQLTFGESQLGMSEKKATDGKPLKESLSFGMDKDNEIVNILVFYSDGHFQQFVPVSK